MPANKKYLTSSPWLRLARILAGVVGGYLVSLSFHLFLARFLPGPELILTSFFTAYLLWAVLLVLAFTAENVWKLWISYLMFTLLFSIPYIQ